MAEGISLPPVSFREDEGSTHRRVRATGKFRHNDSVYVGPRRAPAGKTQGMSVSPLGYYIVCPLEISDSREILVNRGWVPVGMVPREVLDGAVANAQSNWNEPEGVVNVIGVVAKDEVKGKFSPKHQGGTSRHLLWMDRNAIESATKVRIFPSSSPILLLTETQSPTEDAVVGMNTYPLRPTADEIALNVAVSPETHVGYAATWFGLSGAGVLMTRKLILRGRA
eukprot:CAMPEP_0113299406 /NCGR_PEP_ID=MMETSP0010_2-20120614/1458_1 /TAXON_ID=216773 ORGANISM="Corethron hystrix, Strain 308" /NCGR_SAMPLE_ID=MMETSP0010_2 /ASSEMBLY_ACC=CAM_ASM_000155 /LENGTH=223 /DNA_ID=CAMNT_0000152643 /DNA_START=214 /DNA_END=885 /DNA_ORIENTATION=- /assembly_acc=CAM_ASM_000155